MDYAYDLTIRSELKRRFSGPVVSVRTPFNKNGSLDYRSLAVFIDRMIDSGAAAIVLTRGDSLFTILTDTEIGELTKKTVELTGGRVPVVAADNQWWTGKCIEFARFCREVGADLMMVANPDWAASSTSESLVAHYTAISAEMPVMILTAAFRDRPIPFGLEVIRRLKTGAPGVMAIKDDHPSGHFGRRMCTILDNEWIVMMGGTYEYYLEKYPYGCDCAFSTLLLFRPDLDRAFHQHLEAADYRSAVEIIKTFEMPYFDLISSFTGGFSAGFAATLEIMGIQKRFRRPPYADATDEEVDVLKHFLSNVVESG